MELTLTLPDPVAREAKDAGLLTPEAIEVMLNKNNNARTTTMSIPDVAPPILRR